MLQWIWWYALPLSATRTGRMFSTHWGITGTLVQTCKSVCSGNSALERPSSGSLCDKGHASFASSYAQQTTIYTLAFVRVVRSVINIFASGLRFSQSITVESPEMCSYIIRTLKGLCQINLMFDSHTLSTCTWNAEEMLIRTFSITRNYLHTRTRLLFESYTFVEACDVTKPPTDGLTNMFYQLVSSACVASIKPWFVNFCDVFWVSTYNPQNSAGLWYQRKWSKWTQSETWKLL